MAATLATIDPIMKEVYEGQLEEQLNAETVTLSRVERTSAGTTNETGGKYVTFPIHTRRNAGIGARSEMQALPVPGQQGYAGARIGLKYQYGSIQLTGQAISLSDTDAKAFAEALDQEVNGLKNDLVKDMNRQVYGNGSGRIATVTATGTTVNTVTVDDARLFQIGEMVDIVTLPSTVAVQNRMVTAVNLSTGVVTLSGAAFSSAAAQILTRTGSAGLELTGFDAIINNTSLYNISSATEPTWQAVTDSNGGTGRAISIAAMLTMTDNIRTNGGKTTAIFTSLGIRRAYLALLSQQVQVVNTLDFTGGFKAIGFTTDAGDIPLVVDPDAPKNKLWFMNEGELKVYRDQAWHWLDRTGSMWQRVNDSNGTYDAYSANMVEYHELGTRRRNTHGQMSDYLEA